jgi:hypothetical protein
MLRAEASPKCAIHRSRRSPITQLVSIVQVSCCTFTLEVVPKSHDYPGVEIPGNMEYVHEQNRQSDDGREDYEGRQTWEPLVRTNELASPVNVPVDDYMQRCGVDIGKAEDRDHDEEKASHGLGGADQTDVMMAVGSVMDSQQALSS